MAIELDTIATQVITWLVFEFSSNMLNKPMRNTNPAAMPIATENLPDPKGFFFSIIAFNE
jgi:hypothetical protein